MAFDLQGILWAVIDGKKAPNQIWRIFPDTTVEPWVRIDGATSLCGCTMHIDGVTLLICDAAGRVFAVDQQTRRCGVWASDDILRPPTAGGTGATAIQIQDCQATIAVTGRRLLLRAGIRDSGSAGGMHVLARNLVASDLAFAA